MIIPYVSMNLRDPAVPVTVVQASSRHPSINKYAWLATTIAVLAGLTVLAVEISVLVLFALPTSLLLTALVSLAIVASLLLFGMTIYQLITRYLKPDPIEDRRSTEEKLLLEIKSLKTQLHNEKLEKANRNSEELIEKEALAKQSGALRAVEERIALLRQQLDHVAAVTKYLEEISLLETRLQTATRCKRANWEIRAKLLECPYAMVEKYRSLGVSAEQVQAFSKAVFAVMKSILK
ncbi:hypothetical protein [Chlamydia vaughanii]|uniref:hypothetical protein n=1 Tax=Chlamydia vaughanii TaxID=3112552 RepID=UPI0032B2D437